MKLRYKAMCALIAAAVCVTIAAVTAIAAGGMKADKDNVVLSKATETPVENNAEITSGNGIIGGADGPTAIYLNDEAEYPVLFACGDGVYHVDPNCAGGVPVRISRKDAAEGLAPCDVCVAGFVEFVNGTTDDHKATATPEPLPPETSVYYTNGGNYYHMEMDCSGMEGAALHTLAEAESAGKQPCPLCAAPDVGDEETKVYATKAGGYYHSVSDCSGMTGASEYSLFDAIWVLGKQPCPVCLVEYPTLVAEEDPEIGTDNGLG